MALQRVEFNMPWACGVIEVDPDKVMEIFDEDQKALIAKVEADYYDHDVDFTDQRAKTVLAYMLVWGDAQDNPYPTIDEVSVVLENLIFLTE